MNVRADPADECGRPWATALSAGLVHWPLDSAPSPARHHSADGDTKRKPNETMNQQDLVCQMAHGEITAGLGCPPTTLSATSLPPRDLKIQTKILVHFGCRRGDPRPDPKMFLGKMFLCSNERPLFCCLCSFLAFFLRSFFNQRPALFPSFFSSYISLIFSFSHDFSR